MLAYLLKVSIYGESSQRLSQAQCLYTNVFACFTTFSSIFVSYSYPVLFLCAALNAFTDLDKEIVLKCIKLSSATITNTKQYHMPYNSSSRALFNMNKEIKPNTQNLYFFFKIVFKLIYTILQNEQNLSNTLQLFHRDKTVRQTKKVNKITLSGYAQISPYSSSHTEGNTQSAK